MVDRAVNPIIMGDSTLQFAADNYEAHVSSAAFNPTDNSAVTWKGLSPAASFSFGKKAVWTLDLELAQDWETAESLSQYLLANEGDEVVVTFAPKAGGQAYTATVIITPGAIGGAVDGIPTATVSLGVKGRPEPVA